MKALWKWGGIAVAAILGLLVLGLGAVYVISSVRRSKRYAVPTPALAAPHDSATVARART